MIPALDDGDVCIYRGDALEVIAQLPDGSVDCIVTSPPYWGLRDYGEDGQIGLEASPDEWVARLVAVFRECRRVLTPSGTFWLNVGDAYNAYNGNRGPSTSVSAIADIARPKPGRGLSDSSLKPKDLLGLPWLLAFALRADGWWLRSEIIWAKPNPMPESVTDRPTKAHEQVFLLTKQPRYWYDADAIREAHSREWWNETASRPGNPDRKDGGGRQSSRESSGRHARSVWSITTEPFSAAHFATYPTELVRRCLAAGCPERVCETCGKPSERETNVTYVKSPVHGAGSVIGRHDTTGANGYDGAGMPRLNKQVTTTGWTDCGHNAWRPGLVLDPFMGSGTTALVARRLGLHAIGVELSEEYIGIAARRLQQLSLLGGAA